MARVPARLEAAIITSLLVGMMGAARCEGQAFPLQAPQVFVRAVYSPDLIAKRAHALDDGVNGLNSAQDKKTPLMRTVEEGDAEAVVYLLESGADTASRDGKGDTALDIAKRLKDGRIAEILELDRSVHPPAEEYYVGEDPHLSIKSGQNQVGNMTWGMPGPLMVTVKDDQGQPMPNAPVRFSALPGEGGFYLRPSDGLSSYLILRTNQDGVCGAYFLRPNLQQGRSSITVTAGVPGKTRAIVFHEKNDNKKPWSPRANLFSVGNCTGSVNGDGGETLNWETPIFLPSWIIVEMRYPNGDSHLLKALPGNETTFTVPGSAWDYP